MIQTSLSLMKKRASNPTRYARRPVVQASIYPNHASPDLLCKWRNAVYQYGRKNGYYFDRTELGYIAHAVANRPANVTYMQALHEQIGLWRNPSANR
jgi:hypothetical protein